MPRNFSRDLKRERAIAKAAGPLRVWKPKAAQPYRRNSSRRAAEWLKAQARRAAERQKGAELAGGEGEEKEFG
jgi:hypothetical protein